MLLLLCKVVRLILSGVAPSNLAISIVPWTRHRHHYRWSRKTTQSFARDKFWCIRRIIALFAPKCSAEILVCWSTQNLDNWVKYSSLRSQSGYTWDTSAVGLHVSLHAVKDLIKTSGVKFDRFLTVTDINKKT